MERTSLLGLPVLPFDRDSAAASDEVMNGFLNDRKNISRTSELKEFINKWRPIWLLSPGPIPEVENPEALVSVCRRPIDEAALKLIQHQYDADLLMSYLGDPDGCDKETETFEILCHLMIPVPSLNAFQLSNNYGVGPDLGFVRLYLDTYPEFENEGRPFRRS